MRLMVLLLTVLSPLVLAADLRVADLRCESQANPVAVDVARPRLSWVLESGTRGQRQTAYQVVVASTEARLQRGQGDLWDSGKVESDQQNQIEYDGSPLVSNGECFWKVRVWDKDAKPSGWSKPARWSMGLLAPQDWLARWICAEDGSSVPLADSDWVWFPEGDPVQSAPPGRRFFRKSFAVPAGARIQQATLFATADNGFRVFVNAVEVGRGSAWETVAALAVGSRMVPGTNVLAIAAENGGSGPNPAGLIGKLVVHIEDGRERVVPIDGTWHCSRREEQGWTEAGFDDRGWVAPKVLGRFGIEPWKTRSSWAAPLPLFRRGFEVRKPIRRAVVQVCGLGHFDLFLDGRKVGDHFLDPAWSVFGKTVYYSTFDITRQLTPGRHAFGAMLGKGFYNTAGDRRVHGVNANRPLKLILQAHLTYTDGSEQTVLTDGSWRTSGGPITHSAILGGEDYDARALPPDWSRPEFDDAAWNAVQVTEGPGGTLVASFSPPMKMHDVFKPVRIDEPEPGRFVYDFGQNASAVPRLRVRGQAGQVVKLVPAEQRHGMSPRRNDGRGLVNQAGVGSPNYFQYTLRGGSSEEWTPQFSYTGFQYLQVEGAVPNGRPNPGGLPVIEELESVHVRNDATVVGRFECSNPGFNAVDRGIDWAVRANLAHVLTDCPHREKLGWLEVSYLMGPSIAGRYDIARFYRKVASDCVDSQAPDGMVPTVAPAYPTFSGGFAYTPEWGAAAVIVPQLVHEWYGDLASLRASYAAMKGFVDYMRKTSKALVPVPGLGDWYDYGHGKPVGASQFTPVELSAMATFYRCTRVVAATAALLGKPEDQRAYEQLASQIRDAFNARYFDGAAEYRNTGSPQCANSMALVLGMVPPGSEQPVLDRIVEDLRRRGNQQTAGDIGYVYLVEALARNGRSDVLFDIASRTNLGSYGFIVNNGWTSMPEAWDADTGASMNHCMLGHIQQWFMGHVAGIRPDPAHPGFARFIIAPEPVGDLTWARASYDSVRGRIESEWKLADGRFLLNILVPPNTRATVVLPVADPAGVREGGKVLDRADGVKLVRSRPAGVVVEVAAGRYRFDARRNR